MRIGELSRLTGASIRSLRYYEECELISATRSGSGQRYFRADTVQRVKIIRQLLAAGLGTKAIRDVLPCLTEPAAQTEELTKRLVVERDRLAAEIAHRAAMHEALEKIIDASPAIER